MPFSVGCSKIAITTCPADNAESFSLFLKPIVAHQRLLISTERSITAWFAFAAAASARSFLTVTITNSTSAGNSPVLVIFAEVSLSHKTQSTTAQ